MNPTLIVIIIAILFVVIVLLWRTGFWRWLVNLFRKPIPTPAPEPDPKPETDLDVTTSTDDKIVLLLDKLIREQRKTVSQANIISYTLDRIRGHLVFYTVLGILSLVGGCVVFVVGLGGKIYTLSNSYKNCCNFVAPLG